MSACIGWEGECTEYPGAGMHGCRWPDGHNWPHECLCGERARNPREMKARTGEHAFASVESPHKKWPGRSVNCPGPDTTKGRDVMTDVTQTCDAALILSDVERMARQVGFNMPASWEEMEALGLDPLTGEPT